ncbi:hypothetical protein Fmac_032677 [Flemingia macrophylla]|uniref:Fe-S metabolism associated domain-containing protein n=1 Tax=Flemingia macrophylla TaxID=520843 RepID=A0ABD1L5L6_9FABA
MLRDPKAKKFYNTKNLRQAEGVKLVEEHWEQLHNPQSIEGDTQVFDKSHKSRCMKAFFWNARGLDNPDTRRTLKHLIVSHKPHPLGLAEPMCSFTHSNYWTELGFRKLCTNSKENLWLLFSETITAAVIGASDQFVAITVSVLGVNHGHYIDNPARGEAAETDRRQRARGEAARGEAAEADHRQRVRGEAARMAEGAKGGGGGRDRDGRRRRQRACARSKVAKKLDSLASEFTSLAEPIERVKRLLHYASLLPTLEATERVPENRVTGCAMEVWVVAEVDERRRMRCGWQDVEL